MLSVLTLPELKKENTYFVFSWNHAFKNQITTLQGQAKNRANPNRSEVQANLSLFLEAASGFYTQVSCKKYVGRGVFAYSGCKCAWALCCLGAGPVQSFGCQISCAAPAAAHDRWALISYQHEELLLMSLRKGRRTSFRWVKSLLFP